MIIALKVIISLIIAMVWYKLTLNQEISIAFFLLMLIVFFLKPIPYQSPTEREEYIQKIREAREKQISIEQMRRDEKRKAREEKTKRDKKKEQE